MSEELLQLGPVPAREDCAQVGEPDYAERSARECQVYRRLLARQRPIPIGCRSSVRLTVRSFGHAFGPFREVCVEFNAAHPAAREYAMQLESEPVELWDDIARYELMWLERRSGYQRAMESGRLAPEKVPATYLASEPPEPPAGRTLLADLLQTLPP